jgi:hypothetical protein
MRAPGLNRRTRDFLLILAQLALIAYLFQVLAIDHWNGDPSHLVGIEGSQAHVEHCHGDISGCSEGAGTATTIILGDMIKLPSPPLARLQAASPDGNSPIEAFAAIPYEPPRAG